MNVKNLPDMMTGADVAKVMGVCRATGYNIMKKPGFPVIVVGKRKIVPKESFIRWLKAQTY